MLCARKKSFFPFHHWVKETKRAILGTAEIYGDFPDSSRGFGAGQYRILRFSQRTSFLSTIRTKLICVFMRTYK
jgi:hypothetical protein